jgi:hypothetical protein
MQTGLKSVDSLVSLTAIFLLSCGFWVAAAVL